MIFCPQRYNTKRRLSSVFRNFLSGCQSKGCVFRFYNCFCELLIFDAVFRRKARISPVNAVSATRSVERNIQLILARLRDADGSISLRIATKKILLLHRRTSVYEPRPNISPRPPRPSAMSAGRGRLPAPSSAPIRGTRGDTPRPAPEGAPGNPRHRRFLPSFCPCGTCWPRGCAVLPSFGPWRGWLLLPDLHRHFRIPSNCSLLTANCNRPLFHQIVRISSAATSIRLNANIFLPKSLRDAPR